jgi:hypothetical protein
MIMFMPDVETGFCLGSEGNEVHGEEGGEGGPGPPDRGKINSQCPTRAGTTWRRMRRTNQSDVMRRIGAKQSEQSSDQVQFCKHEH